jgi:hypothetical protein
MLQCNDLLNQSFENVHGKDANFMATGKDQLPAGTLSGIINSPAATPVVFSCDDAR